MTRNKLEWIKNTSISSAAPEIILLKVTPGSLASEFSSSTFKVTESLPYLTSQDMWPLIGPDPYGPHCHVAEPRIALLHQFQHRSFLSGDPSGSIGTISNTLGTIAFLYCFTYSFINDWSKNEGYFNHIIAVAILSAQFWEKTH